MGSPIRVCGCHSVVSFLITPLWIWLVWWGLMRVKAQTPYRHMYERKEKKRKDWTMCSQFNDYSQISEWIVLGGHVCSFKVLTKRAHLIIVPNSWGDVIVDMFLLVFCHRLLMWRGFHCMHSIVGSLRSVSPNRITPTYLKVRGPKLWGTLNSTCNFGHRIKLGMILSN